MASGGYLDYRTSANYPHKHTNTADNLFHSVGLFHAMEFSEKTLHIKCRTKFHENVTLHIVYFQHLITHYPTSLLPIFKCDTHTL